ncbi:MAG TPA: FAD-binding oxidoreductase [Candidatus Acidoferrum sp.]|nr:FAD-binding oxidoreductase [Candidatus Acidoferrum sp.]
MLYTQSPWLFELQGGRKAYTLNKAFPKNDIVVIGAGIAGIMTAYYILTMTKKNVVVLETNTIASGATGHNAGQIVNYFERPFREIVEEFGHDMAWQGQQDINSAWDQLREIQIKTKLKTPIYTFEGLSGCAYFQSVYEHLESRFYRPQVAHQKEFGLIADDCEFLDHIPAEFSDLYTVVPRRLIMELLETKDPTYSAAFTSKKGCMNSAMFCEEVAAYLLRMYPTRFQIYEGAHVSEVQLSAKDALITINSQTQMRAQKVVLCTNGFRDMKLIGQAGAIIDIGRHEALHGKVGYMKAYSYKDASQPTAISYYNTASYNEYFYLTRRPSTLTTMAARSLISVGGPEYVLPDKSEYTADSRYPAAVSKAIDAFVGSVLATASKEGYEHMFIWHGLMGYTNNGLRIIGPDTHNPNLLYNLGCNGVGILPSIFGGKKIALFLNGRVHKKSIFDPQG